MSTVTLKGSAKEGKLTARDVSHLLLADFALDQGTRRASIRGEDVDLSPKEFAIMELLMSRAPGLITVREIALHAWEDDSRLVGSNTIHVHMGRLKRKLNRARARIVTVRGQGFRLEPIR